MGNKERILEAYRLGMYQRVLELGPYNGYDTVHLCQNARQVVCLEARAENIKRTYRTLEVAQCDAEIIAGNLETFDLELLGKFDVVWASGVLYHLPHPVRVIERIKSVTNRCLGWTHLAEEILGTRDGYQGRFYEEAVDHRLAGLSSTSWWMSPREFMRAWKQDGWAFDYLTAPEPHENGGLEAQFVAWKADHST